MESGTKIPQKTPAWIGWLLCKIRKHDWKYHEHKRTGFRRRVCNDCKRRETLTLAKDQKSLRWRVTR